MTLEILQSQPQHGNGEREKNVKTAERKKNITIFSFLWYQEQIDQLPLFKTHQILSIKKIRECDEDYRCLNNEYVSNSIMIIVTVFQLICA